MRKIFLFGLLIVFAQEISAQKEKRKVYTTTPVYDSIIAVYERLDKQSPMVGLYTIGETDIGRPLHACVLMKDTAKHPFSWKNDGKTVLLINNGIHPGEPDGIDASIELLQHFLQHPAQLSHKLAIVIIPVYNVDGCLNRGKFSRANQNGPEEYGFRGNARNLDLNRDFIKADAKNTRSLQWLFQQIDPDVFIDTHVSNGSDYQYTMTLITSQRSKLSPALSPYMTKELGPALYAEMKKKGLEMCPYVDTRGRTPDDGIVEFCETPRFSTGYAAQFNCLGLVSETHMWKPYNDRVWSTYELLLSLAQQVTKDADKIKRLRLEAKTQMAAQNKFPVNWQLDTSRYELMDFKGYEAREKPSNITGLQRLYYDRSKPFVKKIKFYPHYKATDTVTAPATYIIPQAWTNVAELMKTNGIRMRRLSKDTVLTCEMYYIEKYETVRTPYESHYMHYDTKVRKQVQQVQFRQGDFVIALSQSGKRYIVESLEPEHDDSFFAWNYFDGVLQQKEWFSDYIFEEQAEKILQENPKLKAELEEKRKADKEFAANHWAQLNFIYQRSVYKEITHNRYPVGRLPQQIRLPLD